ASGLRRQGQGSPTRSVTPSADSAGGEGAEVPLALRTFQQIGSLASVIQRVIAIGSGDDLIHLGVGDEKLMTKAAATVTAWEASRYVATECARRLLRDDSPSFR